ncbi:MAG: carbamoyltransferase [Alphaproteobacteria bacterium]|nr:carbamoyltransferase [Alphaproteobacteria bacterium]
MPQYHLGISCYFHDAAAAIVNEDGILAAAQQERFSRRRHDKTFPRDAIAYCLDTSGIELNDLSSVSYYEKPNIKFWRTITSFACAGPNGANAFADVLPGWLGEKRRMHQVVARELRALGRGTPPVIRLTDHHRSHAASAFLPSPFSSAAVLCIDGVGEWHTTTIWHGQGTTLHLVNSISYPHSLGLLYSAFTYYCGFKVDSGEYKLMGLAPYGLPRYASVIKENVVSLKSDGSFSLNLNFFTFLEGKKMVGKAFEELFGHPARQPETELSQFHCDIAASIQQVTNEAVIGLANTARHLTGEHNLCIAGGVGLNCVTNGKLSEANIFNRIWIQPAAGDAGSALGAALDAQAQITSKRPASASINSDAMKGSLLGPEFSDAKIRDCLIQNGYVFTDLTEPVLYETVSHLLNEGKVVGWFQGRMEFGPRALGARSIIGDPRRPEMQKTMNLRIKYRESFRPFAPSVLENMAGAYFDMHEISPYMLIVSHVRLDLRHPILQSGIGSINQIRSDLPAITHLDYSARIQTVGADSNPRFASLIKSFYELTGCPIVVNTSFNVRGEPIVCTPQDALRCFMRTDMDALILGTCLLKKTDQLHHEIDHNWREEIPLD